MFDWCNFSLETLSHCECPEPSRRTTIQKGQSRIPENPCLSNLVLKFCIFVRLCPGLMALSPSPLLVAVPWAVGPQRSRAEKPRLAHGAHGVHSALGCLAAVAAVGPEGCRGVKLNAKKRQCRPRLAFSYELCGWGEPMGGRYPGHPAKMPQKGATQLGGSPV